LTSIIIYSYYYHDTEPLAATQICCFRGTRAMFKTEVASRFAGMETKFNMVIKCKKLYVLIFFEPTE